MLYYENCRNFDPSYKNKAETFAIATQHLRFGYHAYRNYPKQQRKMEIEWDRYSIRSEH